MKHMRDRGFMLLDLRRTYWTPTRVTAVRNHRGKGLLMFGDALFLIDPFLERNHQILASADARLIERHSSRRLPVGPWLRVRRLMALVERFVKWSTAVRSGLALTEFYQGDGPLGN